MCRPSTARVFCLALALALTGACASTVDRTLSNGFDGGLSDVLPGLNPDGLDPFRPADGAVVRVDGATDSGTWQAPDGPVFDQRYGYIYLGTLYDGTEPLSYVSAEFRYLPRVDDPRCTVLAEGRWDLQTCSLTGSAAPDTHPRPFPNAGVLRFTGGRRPVTLLVNPQGGYTPFYVYRETVFSGPETVALHAAGGREVPAFDLAIVVPPAVANVTPMPVEGVPLVIDRRGDFILHWAPTMARSVWLTLTVPQNSNEQNNWYRINAEYPGALGVGALPRRALEALPPTRSGRHAMLTVLPYEIATSRVGAWPLQVTAVGQGVVFEVELR